MRSMTGRTNRERKVVFIIVFLVRMLCAILVFLLDLFCEEVTLASFTHI